jgi:23S rRNA pseudouridine1911/1915/1917 synthase
MTVNRGFVYAERIGSGGATVLEHLARRYPRASAEAWAARIAGGEVALDDARAAPDARLRSGQVLAWHRPPWDEPDVDTGFTVLLEDASVLAVAKPRGLPTLPGGGFLEHTLLAVVRATFPGVSPMHRLGRETSGIVLFARTPAAGEALQRAWRRHAIRKRYRGLGSGLAGPDVLEITAPIGPVPHPWLGTVHAASATGRPSRSVARVLERRPGSTLFAVDIDTGRPHQIRIHLAFVGHPLVGDPLYGPGGAPYPEALPGDGGYLLHAERLGFPHPDTGQPVDLRALPPVELLTAAEV